MYSYEEAYKIAKKLKENIDHCIETEKAYFFSNNEENEIEADGGYDSAIVMKDSGKCLNHLGYIYEINYKKDKTIREFDIE